MATEIVMPQLSDTMNEGKILTWLKSEGDKVSRGDALAEVATDKADLEIECFHEGVLLKIHTPKGTTVKVGQVIATVGKAGEKAEGITSEIKAAPASAPKAEAPKQAAVQPSVQPAAQSNFKADFKTPVSVNGAERVKISPLAKNIAEAHGVDYSTLSGSGEGGRIVRRDVEGAIGKASAPAQVKSGPVRAAMPAQPVSSGTLSRMRQTIATRMVESKTTIPHFYVTSKVNVKKLEELRATLKEHPNYEGVTLNHLLVKATGLALRAVPRINAAYQDGNLVQPGEINIGIVTALEDGLLIPVLKNADELPLSDIVSEGISLVKRARAGKPKGEDLTGGTFSISNMGKAEVENFSAIISPGQGGILAVSPINDEPIVDGGEIKPGRIMRLTVSVDHRIIDGVVAGAFLTEVKRLLEEPVLLLA